jgi:hypothetical protein
MNRATLVGLVVLLASQSACASEEWPVTVYQPLVLLDGELALRQVTYISYMSEPGLELAFTCRVSQIQTDSGLENRNAASLFGMSVTVNCNPRNPIGSEACRYGDTLRVVLNLPSTPPDTLARDLGIPVDTALVATLECLAANVRRWPGLRFLSVTVAGRPELARYGRTWNITSIPAEPRTREFVW